MHVLLVKRPLQQDLFLLLVKLQQVRMLISQVLYVRQLKELGIHVRNTGSMLKHVLF